MKRFSLLSLLLLIALIGAALAWWLERTKEHETLYLHVFATHVKPVHDREHPDVIKKMQGFDGPVALSNRSGTTRPVRLATLSFTPSIYFQDDVPNAFSPAIHVEGKLLAQDRDHLQGELSIRIEKSEYGVEVRGLAPVVLEEAKPIEPGYFFVVSRNPNPYELAAANESAS